MDININIYITISSRCNNVLLCNTLFLGRSQRTSRAAGFQGIPRRKRRQGTTFGLFLVWQSIQIFLNFRLMTYLYSLVLEFVLCFSVIKVACLFQGDTGYQGRQGSPGFPSNCDVTPSLQTKCPKGAKGAYGIKGSTGAEGDVGRTGANGPRGNQGFKGARGDAGVPGGVGLYGALRLSSPCRHLYSPWVVPYGSPIGQLKTECRFREYLLALNIQPDNNSNRIRYDYKCCPF